MLQMIQHPMSKMVFLLIIGLGIISTSNILNPPVYGVEHSWFDNLWPGLIGMLVASLGFIDVHATSHANKIEKGETINHPKSWFIRVFVSFALCSLIHAYAYDIQKVLLLMLASGFWFGIMFNLLLNYKRDVPFDYLGKDGKNSSWIDSLFNNAKHGGIYLYIVYLVGLIVASYFYLS